MNYVIWMYKLFIDLLNQLQGLPFFGLPIEILDADGLFMKEFELEWFDFMTKLLQPMENQSKHW